MEQSPIGAYYFNQNVGVMNREEAEIPTEYRLYAPYPNPFNPATHIRFDLPSEKHVVLMIYDITGRQVAKLIDGFKPAGIHQVVFDAKDLSSGVYFARLEAGEFKQTRKLLLLK